jgi:ectoine hydroxylase-related dioxygenase (phytanoyl-CoA dioxygenase family)
MTLRESPSRFVSKGLPVDPSLVGEYRDSTALLNQPERLRQRLAEDGYLLLRGVQDPAVIAAARAEIFGRLANVGEVREPSVDGIATGTSLRRERQPDLGAFWKSVCEGPALRAVSHGPHIIALLSALFDEPAVALDYIALRTAAKGKSTGLHFDGPYFTRHHSRVLTCWMPLGEVAPVDGPLVVVEGSNRFDDLIEEFRDFDIAIDTTRRADIAEDFGTFASQRGARVLTTHFKPGDVLVFGMFTLHGSLDNASPLDRIRLSVDVRYQPASAPRDIRYFGENPAGRSGGGYGELNGARPLTEKWHDLTGDTHSDKKTG